MKRIKLIALFLLFILKASAQNTGGGVEVRLTLLHGDQQSGDSALAVKVSVINHYSRDIYIPGFFHFASTLGLHYYQQEGKDWKEVDIHTHDYWKETPRSSTRKDGNTAVHADRIPQYFFDSNSLTKKYTSSAFANFRYQDSLLNTYYNAPGDHHQISLIDVKSRTFLFLKANQTIDNVAIWSLDWLKKKNYRYKIAFNSEALDSLQYFNSPHRYNPIEKKYDELDYPADIFGYHLFYPDVILSNVIYIEERKK